MKHIFITKICWVSFVFLQVVCNYVYSQRTERLLEKDWKFSKGDFKEAQLPDFDDTKWESVTVPHDWAITGPFDIKNDLQTVAILQNFEKKATLKTGRTGGLPYVGVGWYRTRFEVTPHKNVTLLVDGAMSEARIYVNGKEVCFWPYGYSSFHCDITPYLHENGQVNTLAVRLENQPQSSRWYPGAGLYRNIHLIETNKIHVPVWGTQILTPHVSKELATVRIFTKIVHICEPEKIRIETSIFSPDNELLTSKVTQCYQNNGEPFQQNLSVKHPELWSPEQPSLYRAVSKIYVDGEEVDCYTTRFGIRSIEFVPDKGFYLNGKHRKFQGVCNHHDLGPLGAAVNVSALRHQLTLLKDMGCDAIRTTHNLPAPELVALCDEMGFMMMIEPFDEWDIAKCKNGYHRFFNEWAERDMVNMLHQYRNNPCVVMWSIGNEVPTQCSAKGYQVAKFLQDICHREDPTRLVTCGMDQVTCVLENGFASMLDIPGLNYRTQRYDEAYQKLPQGLVLGSETGSTVSSRGVYKFPVEEKKGVRYEDHQCSAYDVEACTWSNIPDVDFALADDYDWTLGQFVWTGFDYLGEPSPYDTDSWPNHSSMFGIIDLASIPKDRYYLFRSVWNTKDETLHMLPHWTWPGREGEVTPVFVYTSYPSAELFVNGKSYGKQFKNNTSIKNRYRLMWMNVEYEPGELKVIAYDKFGKIAAEKMVKTAGQPHHLELATNRKVLTADGKDLVYVTVKIVDKQGNLCPNDQREIHFAVQGKGRFRAVANGDPTNLEPFHLPRMHAFNGMLTVIVQSEEDAGMILLNARAKGLRKGSITLQSKF